MTIGIFSMIAGALGGWVVGKVMYDLDMKKRYHTAEFAMAMFAVLAANLVLSTGFHFTVGAWDISIGNALGSWRDWMFLGLFDIAIGITGYQVARRLLQFLTKSLKPPPMSQRDQQGVETTAKIMGAVAGMAASVAANTASVFSATGAAEYCLSMAGAIAGAFPILGGIFWGIAALQLFSLSVAWLFACLNGLGSWLAQLISGGEPG